MSRTRRQEPERAWQQKLLRRGLAQLQCIHNMLGGCADPECYGNEVVPINEEVRARLEPRRGMWHLPRAIKRMYWKRIRTRERLARVAAARGLEEDAAWPSRPRHELRWNLT